MRMSTEADRDEERAAETIAAALESGITVFDTAHAYGRGEAELGHNERLLARALRRVTGPAAAQSPGRATGPAGAQSPRRATGPAAAQSPGRATGPAGARRHRAPLRIVTKGGMARRAGGWVPDGRAKAILRDCEASLTALDDLPIDLYLLHAPDPRTAWRTSVRALARLLDEGMVARVGLSNVNRRQLDEALELVPITAVQVALSIHDDRALRGGVVARCEELGIAVIAHSPLGGPRRGRNLARHAQLATAATAHAATPAQVALAWLLELSPTIVAIPGARRPETARSAARAATLALNPEAKAALTRRPTPTATRVAEPNPSDIVVIMGIPGAGKTRLAADYVAHGYARLNRDERGGALRALAYELERSLAAGSRRIVLDNTYLTRAARSYVIEAASRHAAHARCVWLDTPLAQAQINLVERLLDRFGTLPTPEELRELGRHDAGALAPTQQMRALRELEPPSPEEGFATVETIAFTRAPHADGTRGGLLVAAAALDRPGGNETLAAAGDRTAPHLIFDWRPDAPPDDLERLAARLRTTVSGIVDAALCPHGGGPPRCWCRPPLPGLPLAFVHRHGLDPARCTLIGTSSAHRALAAALSARYVAV